MDDVSTVGVVFCESLIGRFPGSEGFRSFSKLPRRKPFRRCNPWRKSRPKGEMAEFRNSRRFDYPRMVWTIGNHQVGVRMSA